MQNVKKILILFLKVTKTKTEKPDVFFFKFFFNRAYSSPRIKNLSLIKAKLSRVKKLTMIKLPNAPEIFMFWIRSKHRKKTPLRHTVLLFQYLIIITKTFQIEFFTSTILQLSGNHLLTFVEFLLFSSETIFHF